MYRLNLKYLGAQYVRYLLRLTICKIIPHEGELSQTDAFIPYNEVEANLSQLPADKNARLCFTVAVVE